MATGPAAPPPLGAASPEAPSTWKRWSPLVAVLPLLWVVAKEVANFDRVNMVLLALAPLTVVVFLRIEVGVYMLLIYGSIVMFIKRMMPNVDGNQLGMVMEALLALMGLRLAIDLAARRQTGLFRTPMTWPVLAYAGYLLLEIFNPLAPSIAFGLYGSRDTMRLLGFFIVLAYFRSVPAIKRFLSVFLGLAVVEGFYGIFQHHHGLLYQEYNWLIESGSYLTHILKGYIRVFATLGDAATFGFLEIVGALMLYALAVTSRGWKQLALIGLTVPMLYAMILSYSRGPMVAFVFGLAAILVVSRNWKLIVSVLLIGAIGLGTLAVVNHKLTDRIMTAKDPSNDASFLVRMDYINKYAPNIITHPFGGGLYTAGASGLGLTNGKRVDGTTVGIPTDNNYFKIGLEQGIVGLVGFIGLQLWLILCTFRIYLRQRDPFLKAVALGLLGVFVTMFVGASSNDIFVQKPLIEFIWMAMGLAMLIGQSTTDSQSHGRSVT